MLERSLNVGGQQLCTCLWGDPTAPEILLLHGLLQQGACWNGVATLLAQRYSVVSPDLRGHGRSARLGRGSMHSILDFLLDVDRVLTKMGPRPVLLVGHSFGAILAAISARVRASRVAGVVLIEPILPPVEDTDNVAKEITTLLDSYVDESNHPVFPSLEVAAGWLRQSNPALSPSFALELAERSTERCRLGVRWTWDPSLRHSRGFLFGGGQSRYLKLLSGIRAPVTFLYGRSSAETPPKDREIQRRALPHAQEHVLDGSHNLHLECPEGVHQHIQTLAEQVFSEPALGDFPGV